MPFSLIIHFKQSYSNVFSRVRSNTLVISSSHLAITTFINAGFGYFYWIVAAHLYPAETVGMSAALISVLSLVATMAPLGLESALVKVLLESRENWARKVYSLFLTIFFSTLLLGILILPLVDALNGGKTGIVSSFWSGLVFILTCLFWTLSLVLDQLFIVEQTTILVLIRNSITACLKLLLLPVTLMITGSDSPLVILAGWGVAALFSSVVTFLIFAWLRRSNLPLQFSLDFRLVRSMLPISMGNYSITVTQQIPATVLPIIVTQMLSPQHNAYFYTVFMFVQGVLLTFPLAISQSFFAQTNNTGLPELLLKMKALLRLTWLIMVPMILGTILLHDPILALFGGEYVREGSGLLVVMSLGTLPATYIRLYISLQRIRNDFKRGFLTTCASLFALIIASFISIQLFGLIGVGIGWTSGLFIVACGLKLDMFHLSRQAAQGRPQQTPWPHAVEDLKNRLQEPSIQDMARKVLGDSSLEVLEWDITRLSGPLANPLSGGIYRVAGTAWDNEQIRNWSAVLKIVTRPSGGGDRPGDWNYWKREALAYQSGLLANLPGGLAAPRCFAVEEALNHREIWMWLEEVKDSSHPVLESSTGAGRV
ncbi:MAG TPA: lipopolysaccharide biosynthesis protein [Chloroflexia bacterium]|nr:lipopolysaccharide biosynthesis protein [Chloroflexia bacterium]